MGPAGAGRPGLDGAGRRRGGRQHRGRRPRRRSQWSGKGAPRAARRGTAAWLGHRRAPLRAPRAPRARLGARGRGRAGRGRRGAGRGLGPGLQPAPEALGGRRDLQEVCSDARGRRSTRGAPCPTGARAKPPAADARSTQPAELGPRRSDRYGTRGLCDFPRGSVGPPSPRTSAETVAVRGACSL